MPAHLTPAGRARLEAELLAEVEKTLAQLTGTTTNGLSTACRVDLANAAPMLRVTPEDCATLQRALDLLERLEVAAASEEEDQGHSDCECCAEARRARLARQLLGRGS